ncbi:MAG TPA: DNA-protecting protein DprA, partial [Rhodanobacteraceae bacterium]|nr:DNA-protecting protein DprA [Rhodanobacteraceae bacterium]
METDEELRAWLTLVRAPGLGGAGIRALVRQAGSARSACVGIREYREGVAAAALEWIGHPDQARLDADLAWLAEPGHRLLLFEDADFPPQLETIAQPPA